MRFYWPAEHAGKRGERKVILFRVLMAFTVLFTLKGGSCIREEDHAVIKLVKFLRAFVDKVVRLLFRFSRCRCNQI
jgi:hypothetical protein